MYQATDMGVVNMHLFGIATALLVALYCCSAMNVAPEAELTMSDFTGVVDRQHRYCLAPFL